MACVTKKILETGGTKSLLNRYLGEVVIPNLVQNGVQQKVIAEWSDVKPSAISDVKTKKTGLDMDSIEKLAIGLGKTFSGLLSEALAWHESPQQSRVARLSITKPNRARAEAALERLGNSPEKVRVWAEAVYAGLRADEDPDPETVVQRMILEKQRDPDATGYPRLKCPNEWPGWTTVRDEFLKRDSLNPLYGPLIFYGKTPTVDKRPDPLEVKTLLPLVQAFAVAHPLTDERWTAANNACAREARKIERGLRKQSKEQRNPTTNKDQQPGSSETQMTPQTPSSTASPPSKKKQE